MDRKLDLILAFSILILCAWWFALGKAWGHTGSVSVTGNAADSFHHYGPYLLFTFTAGEHGAKSYRAVIKTHPQDCDSRRPVEFGGTSGRVGAQVHPGSHRVKVTHDGREILDQVVSVPGTQPARKDCRPPRYALEGHTHSHTHPEPEQAPVFSIYQWRSDCRNWRAVAGVGEPIDKCSAVAGYGAVAEAIRDGLWMESVAKTAADATTGMVTVGSDPPRSVKRCGRAPFTQSGGRMRIPASASSSAFSVNAAMVFGVQVGEMGLTCTETLAALKNTNFIGGDCSLPNSNFAADVSRIVRWMDGDETLPSSAPYAACSNVMEAAIKARLSALENAE